MTRSMRAWYVRIKKRRGSKIARVAVMRRLATILWHMVKHNEAVHGGRPAAAEARDDGRDEPKQRSRREEARDEVFAPRHPCGSFAGIVPASRGTRPLPLHPLPSPPFQGLVAQ